MDGGKVEGSGGGSETEPDDDRAEKVLSERNIRHFSFSTERQRTKQRYY